MRVCCVLEPDQAALFRFADKAFHAYFGQQRNLDDIAELRRIADDCGLDGEELALRSAEAPAKVRLRANTQELVDRGDYGSPTMFVNGAQLYFGSDQLPIVRLALASD